ncbi:hypothetical protein Goe11_c00920 [Bacillus phage vB_BsuS-Goe11]|nr:hypothetical protein Goe11_c00920 [Bacillus phage vB_BsuS-Goe11]UAW07966.1 hypothetical protein [Bacillus phage BUCT082]UIS26537.1 hypothetical protein Goe14_00930 [Bacillus phage vB_BsuS-Goe14]
MELSLDELKLYLKPLVFFGELKLEISDYEEGKKIEVLDHDEGSLINLAGQTINENYVCTTCNCTLYTNENNEVCFIEHPYGAITAVNKDQVIHLTKLIGAIINTDEEDPVE